MKQKHMTIALSDVTGKEPFLSGNENGKKVFQDLQKIVESHPEVQIFGISLKGIVATDASFPRESVVSLIKLHSGEKGFYLKDFASSDLLDNWDYAAKAKGQSIIVLRSGDQYGVIGPDLNAGTKQLLDFIMSEREVTTSKVAKKFDVSAQNASAKMKKVFESGLVLGSKQSAETGGLEFVFTAIR